MQQRHFSGHDNWLSDRHRSWGYNCPAVDLDLPLLEYDRAKCAAMVEYKKESARGIRFGASIEALRDLCDGYSFGIGPLPFFVVFYEPSDAPVFDALPQNAAARGVVEDMNLPRTALPEPAFVTLLDYLRRIRRIGERACS